LEVVVFTPPSALRDKEAHESPLLIGPNGHAVAKLPSLDAPPRKRRLGLLKGKLVVPEDFDAPLLDDVLAEFEGATEFAAGRRMCCSGQLRKVRS
jgi:hypothetical protein